AVIYLPHTLPTRRIDTTQDPRVVSRYFPPVTRLQMLLRLETASFIALVVSPAFAAQPVKHAFLATGGETFIADESGKVTWKYPQSSRDGWVLDNGNVLLALSKSKTYPGGAVAEVDKDGKVVFEFKGTQSEVNTVQPLGDG